MMVFDVQRIFVEGGSETRPGSYQPKLLDMPSVVRRDEGQTAVLFCSVVNLGQHTVTWRRLPNTSPLTIGVKSWTKDPRIQSEHVPNSSQWNLVIERVVTSDAGQYECQVSRRRSKLRRLVTLVVNEPVAQLPQIQISGDSLLKFGATLKLVCNASLVGGVTDKVAWLKDNKPLELDDEDRLKVHTSVKYSGFSPGSIISRLDLGDARVDDSGEYQCRTEGRHQMAGMRVDVQGEPTLKRADQMPKYADAPQTKVSHKFLADRNSASLTTALSYHYLTSLYFVTLCGIISNLSENILLN